MAGDDISSKTEWVKAESFSDLETVLNSHTFVMIEKGDRTIGDLACNGKPVEYGKPGDSDYVLIAYTPTIIVNLGTEEEPEYIIGRLNLIGEKYFCGMNAEHHELFDYVKEKAGMDELMGYEPRLPPQGFFADRPAKMMDTETYEIESGHSATGVKNFKINGKFYYDAKSVRYDYKRLRSGSKQPNEVEPFEITEEMIMQGRIFVRKEPMEVCISDRQIDDYLLYG